MHFIHKYLGKSVFYCNGREDQFLSKPSEIRISFKKRDNLNTYRWLRLEQDIWNFAIRTTTYS